MGSRGTQSRSDTSTTGVDESVLEKKERRLRDILQEFQSALVAFSGGVDSTYLLALSVDVLGADRVHAATSDTQSLPEEEKLEAAALAACIGVSHEFIHTDEFSRKEYVENSLDRCYHCKDALFSAMKSVASARGLSSVLHGATADDVDDYRPGMRAAEEHGIRAPLLEVGLVKSEIRVLSKKRGLSTFDKPGMACLSSRIPYGEPVTSGKLGQVERAEHFLRNVMGIRDVRVRHHGTVARIEVGPEDMEKVLRAKEEIVRQFRNAGFRYTTLDLSGFRSGSMNEVLDG